MKKLLFTLATIFVSSLVVAQETQIKNYVKTTTYQVSTSTGSVTNDQKIETITYYDGLGRPEQTRTKQAGGNKEDIITPKVYDGFGRVSQQYLPYSDSGTSSLYYETTASLISNIESYYIFNFPDDIDNINPNPYSESTYDSSPLNRILQQAAPGEDWEIGSGHEIDFEYDTNTSGEVKRYDVNLSFANNTYTPTLSLNSSDYPANTLSKSITKDENWTGDTNHTTEEFKDNSGRVILKRTYADINSVSTAHDTYYVYDEYGNLTYVLPPKSEPHSGLPNSIELDELCYQYKYDVRNRLVEKKIPGKGWESIVYNLLDKPVLTQDSELNLQNKWLFTKYDAFGRLAYTGIKNVDKSRVDFQVLADNTNSYDQYVTQQTSYQNLGGVKLYYTNVAIPTTMDTILTVNYYDSYVDLPTGLNSTVTTYYSLTSTTDTESLPTVSKVRVLGTNDWITTVSYYDDKGRSIYVYSTNPYLGTTDIVESKFDFTGKPEEIKTTHTKGSTTITTLEKFYYDHTGRVTKQTHKINNEDEEVITQNTYDELGELVIKKVGNTESSPLQTVDYSYNVRGWLKQINDVNSIGTDLFLFKLNYNTGTGAVLYNGNISQTQWKTANTDTSLKTYSYTYDALNRITNGLITNSNSSEDNKHNLKLVEYDKNGNITKLRRNGYRTDGVFDEYLDHLTYNYDSGNKLVDILEEGHHYEGFSDKSNTQIGDFTYDDNGNLTKDLNKGIGVTTDGITYNHLNLPTLIDFGNNNKIEYFYDATGVKLKKKVTENSNMTITDYDGDYIFEDGNLQFIFHPEGFVEPNGTGFNYVY
ncbi:MAG: DUF6443 domain-containing protein, partial [Bacteroidota bacterium]